MTVNVAFTPEAEGQLIELYRYIAASGTAVAARYVDDLVAYCEELAAFPHRGKARDDIRPGLRTIGFKRRAIVAFAVLGQQVVIVGIFYGGRDYETIPQPAPKVSAKSWRAQNVFSAHPQRTRAPWRRARRGRAARRRLLEEVERTP